MRASDMFPSKYLKASDLGESTPVVTISKVVVESLGAEDEKEDKMVVYFQGKDKGLVCNKTNCNTISGLFGEETDDWIGKKIKILTAEVAFKGKMTLSIRVSSIKVAQGNSAAKASKIENQTEDATDGVETENIPF